MRRSLRRATALVLAYSMGITALPACSTVEPARDPFADPTLPRPEKDGHKLFLKTVKVDGRDQEIAPVPYRLLIAPIHDARDKRVASKTGARGGAAPGGAGGEKAPAGGGGGDKAPEERAPGGDKTGRVVDPASGDPFVYVVRYRKPLFPSEVLFAPSDPPEAPPAGNGPTILKLICPRCQKDVGREDSSCPECGLAFAPFEEPALPPEPAAGAAPAPPPGMRIIWVCFACSKEVGEKDPSCKHCVVAFTPDRPPVPVPVPVTPPEPASPVVAEGPKTGETPAVAEGPKTGETPAVAEGPKTGETPAPPAPAVAEGPKTGETPAAAAPAAPASREPEAPPADASRLVCYACGGNVASEALSCEHCGFALAPMAGSSAVASIGSLGAGEFKVDENDRSQGEYKPDAIALQKDLEDCLKRYHAFSEVTALNKPELAGDEERLFQEAEALDYDLMLIPIIKKWQIKHVGVSTGKYIGAMALWVAIGEFPGMFMGIDRFRADLEFEFKLVGVRSRKEITWPGKAIVKDAEFDLSQWERGWYPWSILGSSYMNLAIDWLEVQRLLGPVALKKVERDLLGAVYKAYHQDAKEYRFREVQHEGEKSRKYALLVGVGTYAKDAIAPLKYAASDCLDVAAIITAKEQDYSKDGTVVLTDREATLANVRKWMTDIQRRVSKDQIFIYFSGYGAVNAKGEAFLCLQDTDPADLDGTALPVAEVAKLLDEIKPERAVVVFDCSFATKHSELDPGIGRARTLDTIPNGATVTGANAFVENVAARPGGNKRACVLTACQPDQAALEYVAYEHGLLTHFLLEAMRGEADDGNGYITIEEIVNYVPGKVAEIGSLGYPQNPGVFGDKKMAWNVRKPAK